MAITLSGTDGITSPSFVPSSTTAPIVGQYLPSANTIGFVTAGTEKLRIDSSGNVGIGINSPGGKLDVRGSSGYLGYFRDSSTGGYASFKTDASGPIIEYGNGSAGLRFSDGAIERIRLDASGNLGIGTNSPASYGKFVVADNTAFVWNIANPSTASVTVGSPTTSTSTSLAVCLPTHNTYYPASFVIDGSHDGGTNITTAKLHAYGVKYSAWGSNIAFYTSSGTTEYERMRIDSAGTLILNQGQIKFPATQVASSDANTLDDYEEGTWTPAINLLGTLTYSVQQGRYTKIGNLVVCTVGITVSSTDTTQDTSSVSVLGLPFVVGYAQPSCALTERCYGSVNTTAPHTFHAWPVSGTSYFNISDNNYNGGYAAASYYINSYRKIYQGGNLYFQTTFSYYV